MLVNNNNLSDKACYVNGTPDQNNGAQATNGNQQTQAAKDKEVSIFSTYDGDKNSFVNYDEAKSQSLFSTPISQSEFKTQVAGNYTDEQKTQITNTAKQSVNIQEIFDSVVSKFHFNSGKIIGKFSANGDTSQWETQTKKEMDSNVEFETFKTSAYANRAVQDAYAQALQNAQIEFNTTQKTDNVKTNEEKITPNRDVDNSDLQAFQDAGFPVVSQIVDKDGNQTLQVKNSDNQIGTIKIDSNGSITGDDIGLQAFNDARTKAQVAYVQQQADDANQQIAAYNKAHPGNTMTPADALNAKPKPVSTTTISSTTSTTSSTKVNNNNQTGAVQNNATVEQIQNNMEQVLDKYANQGFEPVGKTEIKTIDGKKVLIGTLQNVNTGDQKQLKIDMTTGKELET